MRKKKRRKQLFCLGIAGMLLALPACLTGCRQEEKIGAVRQEKEGMFKYSASYLDVFDTETTLVGYADSEKEFMEKAELLHEKLTEYHKLYDIYHSYAGMVNLYTVNETAGSSSVRVSEDLMDLLTFGKEMYDRTEGQTNIAMGSVLSIWHEYREAGLVDPEHASLPKEELLLEAAAHTKMEDLRLDPEHLEVSFADPEMTLDVGGIAKGYAVQRLSEYAESLGMENLLISVGGNISAMGKKEDGSRWILGIQNPDLESPESYVQKVQAENECVVTSGDYQRYYTVDGKKYCHIIDPDTWMPADYVASVSILMQDSGEADALSTAVFNMPLEEGQNYIESQEGVEAMWILKDGSLVYSENFEKFLSK